MAKLPVEIIDLRERPTPDLDVAVAEGNRVQDELEFTLLEAAYADALRLSVLSDIHSGTFFDAMALRRKEWRGFHPFIICFVDSLLRSDRWSNLFGTRRSTDGSGIVTSFGVEGTLVPTGRMAAYYLYELASHTLAFIVSGRKHHRESRGCVFDFKEDRRRILDSIKAGTLCDECRSWFFENGENLSPAQLSAVSLLLDRSSKLLEPSNVSRRSQSRPRVFLGSSVEGLDVARAVQSELQFDYAVEIWNQNTVFGLGAATMEALENAVNTYDYGIFVFTPDDQITKRSQEEEMVPRDNVVFEAGLFIGRLGRFKTFIVCPRFAGIQLPSDLKGLVIATYDPGVPNVDASVGPACRQIRSAIAQSG